MFNKYPIQIHKVEDKLCIDDRKQTGLLRAEGVIQMRVEILRRKHCDIRQRVLNIYWGACALPSPSIYSHKMHLSRLFFLNSFAHGMWFSLPMIGGSKKSRWEAEVLFCLG